MVIQKIHDAPQEMKVNKLSWVYPQMKQEHTHTDMYMHINLQQGNHSIYFGPNQDASLKNSVSGRLWKAKK